MILAGERRLAGWIRPRLARAGAAPAF